MSYLVHVSFVEREFEAQMLEVSANVRFNGTHFVVEARHQLSAHLYHEKHLDIQVRMNERLQFLVAQSQSLGAFRSVTNHALAGGGFGPATAPSRYSGSGFAPRGAF